VDVSQGNLVGPEDADDSDVEIAPDDHELNYDEQQMATGMIDQLSQVNSVFNERHIITESQVRHQCQLSLTSSGVAKLSTSFSWSKDGKVTAVRWQVTLCDPVVVR